MTISEPRFIKIALEEGEVRRACDLTRIDLRATAVKSVFRAGLEAMAKKEAKDERKNRIRTV